MTPFSNEPIAIIGSGCRFPGGASSPSGLWNLLREPRDCLTEIPKDRFNWEGYYHPHGPRHGSTRTKHSYFLHDDIRKFDPHFFNIQPGEADSIDPQQRLLLETVYEGLESAGLTIEGLQGSSTAVYVGMMSCDYADVVQRDIATAPTYTSTGISRSIHSNRISYFFDWHGPSMTIDTACSSSMMAIHLAAQSLRSGDSRVAVACGSNIILAPEPYVALSSLSMIATDGRGKMWDSSADGYARGEGVGALILKTLSAAEADGDSIECIIRETSINQDGRTRGITMPSSTAQASLIRQTYERAGLDLRHRADRPQYFEAHGTGTMVGDPREAEAAQSAFFGDGGNLTVDDMIHIGSIKTVVGHTEGTAGLAGVLKASLALKHGLIPPNMLFNEMNPAVAPFAKHLRLATALTTWPSLPQGVPRRASVNSFGFGGSNGHAILESYTPAMPVRGEETDIVATPFVFSAQSERSLTLILERFVAHLESNPNINLRDIAWTLQHKRSTFAVRTTTAAVNIDDLLSRLKEKLAKVDGGQGKIGVKSQTRQHTRILGIFTGQGAQWAGMGREILCASSTARDTMKKLDEALAHLPVEHRPSWTIQEELCKDKESSRIGEAALSQPLCTAIQILLVDMLCAAGVQFHTVVGHSSGEIASAYAARLLTARDAIRIAYYRGLYASLAGGKDGQRGAMMAAGTSLEDATKLCAMPAFRGRLSVAACNSSTSLTLSGDHDAVEAAKAVYDEEKTFARVLKVDTAYHSHHMKPCAQPYLAALEACKISPLTPDSSAPQWVSSVHGGRSMTSSEDLASSYWVSNMVQPVLFSSAVEAALAHEAFDLALEVGPHPALQAPTLQTIQDIKGNGVPYSGALSRGKNDIESFASALGLIWTHSARKAVSLEGYDNRFFPEAPKPSFIRELPSYPWDHERSYWSESRIEKSQRNRHGPLHSLIGVPYGDATDSEVKWRNLLTPKEIPWLLNHQIQGQATFPGAGYVVMAWEAALLQVGEQPVQLIEVQDIAIHQAISFKSETTSIEVVVALSNMKYSTPGLNKFTAQWTIHSPPTPESVKLALVASGTISLLLGPPSPDNLPDRCAEPANTIEVDVDEFYETVAQVGYGFTGPFRLRTSLRRKLNYSSSTFEVPTTDMMLVHPALVDMGFQMLLAAQSHPGDGALWTLHVPTSIQAIRMNPYYCPSSDGQGLDLHANARIVAASSQIHVGEVSIFAEDGHHGLLQIEGISTVPFTKATPKDDRNLFSEEVWDRADPDGLSVLMGHRLTPEELDRFVACERVAHFYLKRLRDGISAAEEENAAVHHRRLLAWATKVTTDVRNGMHVYGRREWVEDTEDAILSIFQLYPDDLILKLMRSVGEAYPSVVRGHSNILEYMTKDNMLNRVYTEGRGFNLANIWAGRLIKQLSHRHARMNIIEIGAGTGGASQALLDHVNSEFQSYTYTDISTAFFETAQERFKEHAHKMIFKPFDMEKPPRDQGFEEHSYDLVLASNVLHATRDIPHVLRNVRSLLRPGGYLVPVELVDDNITHPGFIMGGLPGWWLGEGTREMTPTLAPAQWNSLLQKTGYSGVDTISMCQDYTMAAFVSQAIDDRVSFLRQPLFSQTGRDDVDLGELLILGGKTLQSSKIATAVSTILAHHYTGITIVNSLEELDTSLPGLHIPPTVLFLVDLDEPIFKQMTAAKLEMLRVLLTQGRNILWITQGCASANPYANMSVGLGRSVSWEHQELRLQFVDVEDEGGLDAIRLSEMLLRLRATEVWDEQGQDVQPVLWTTESEYRIVDGELLIPRVYQQFEQNARYNSARRQITHEVGLDNTSVSISYSTGSGTFRLLDDGHKETLPPPGIVTIRVLASTFSSIRAVDGRYLFVSLGERVQSRQTVVALSERNASILHVPEDVTIPIDGLAGGEKGILLRTAWGLLAQTIITRATFGGTILTRGLDKGFLTSLRYAAESTDVNIKVITTDVNVRDLDSIFIHSLSSQNTIQRQIPAGVSVFVDLSDTATQDTVHTRILDTLPPDCAIVTSQSLLSPIASTSTSAPSDVLRNALTRAVYHAQNTPPDNPPPNNLTLSVKDIPNYSTSDSRPLHIVDWAADTHIPVDIESVDAKILFSPDKTYLLIGLTADLGQSLCEWMVGHGARYIVLASRNPRVNQEWLDSLTAAGATVRVCRMDITDKESLQAGYEEIRRTLPPIAGVANGAMVLRDIMFSNMKLGDLLPTLKPKVDGSRYLDELFGDQDLEFFILFSSLGQVNGNGGQSSYTAANAFMASLAEQRRQRGLSAAVMHIGAIIGAGYITRAGHWDAAGMDAIGAIPLSTSDFHQMFAEAVLASPPGSGRNPQIITGLREIDPIVDDRVPWRASPKMSHLLRTETEYKTGSDTARSSAPVRVQLAKATTKAQAKAILQESFADRLVGLLQLQAEDMDRQSALVELGVDSLIAVEVRSWFTKQLAVDIPVLRILGGASVLDLVEDAFEHLSPELLPNVKTDDEEVPSRGNATGSPKRPSAYGPSEVNSATGSTPSIQSTHTPLSSDSSTLEISTPSLKTDINGKSHPVIVKTEPMSYTQLYFWRAHRSLEDPTTYNVTSSLRLTGNFDPDVFAQALRTAGALHQGLRTCFFEEDGQPIQGILDTSPLHLERRDMTSADESDIAAEYQRLQGHKYDLKSGRTMRILLLEVSPQLNYLLIGNHHIAMDGSGFGGFLQELMRIVRGEKIPEPTQYPDYSRDIREALESGRMDRELSYWRKEFTTIPPAIPLLPISRVKQRAPLTKYEHSMATVQIDTVLVARIKNRSRKFQATAFHFYLAVFKAMLCRLLDIDEICIGIANSNRTDLELTRIMGALTNPLPLRFKSNPSSTFSETVKGVRRKAYTALQNAKVPFNVLLDTLPIQASSTHPPLFQVWINYHTSLQERMRHGDVETQRLDWSYGRTPYDLSLHIMESIEGNAALTILGQTSLYGESEVQHLLKVYTNLLEAFSRDPALRLNEPPLDV